MKKTLTYPLLLSFGLINISNCKDHFATGILCNSDADCPGGTHCGTGRNNGVCVINHTARKVTHTKFKKPLSSNKWGTSIVCTTDSDCPENTHCGKNRNKGVCSIKYEHRKYQKPKRDLKKTPKHKKVTAEELREAHKNKHLQTKNKTLKKEKDIHHAKEKLEHEKNSTHKQKEAEKHNVNKQQEDTQKALTHHTKHA